MKWVTNMTPGQQFKDGFLNFDTGDLDYVDRVFKIPDGCVTGKPQATDFHTVAELEAMGYVGVYKP